MLVIDSMTLIDLWPFTLITLPVICIVRTISVNFEFLRLSVSESEDVWNGQTDRQSGCNA